MVDTLPNINHDQRSMAGRSASVMSNPSAHGIEGQKNKSHIKFSYSYEVLRCFQRVLRHLDDNAVGSAGPIRIDNAGRFYKPSRSDIKVLRFPTIYTELLSMQKRKNTDPEIYVRKKVAECSHHAASSEDDLRKSVLEDKSKKSQKLPAVKLYERETTSMSSNNNGLPTIFELTKLKTPREKKKKKRGA